MPNHQTQGFTLIELMVTIVILAVLVTIAAPAMSDFIEKRRLVGAAEEIQSQIQYARTEAVKQSRELHISIDENEWCIGTGTIANCDCTEIDASEPGACVIPLGDETVMRTTSVAAFPNITLTSDPDNIRIDGVRGLTDTSSITLTSPRGWELRISTSMLGKVRMCSPSGSSFVGGYPEC